ncbi:hypothetical protein K443DRAFT_683622 [Laccaria amethystina LaAM-08-1]|jgi:hypothetical protein|uniref:Uncharacterized protein n=1 Tax=Laccaria amethystina LaAM-08-1 TaxID=1095629 RepID=A0A0C9XA89_9AGAR|nr:hypothetical protein K443DRAFT_683622 [Laccaria amethystina LaAM-08-1]
MKYSNPFHQIIHDSRETPEITSSLLRLLGTIIVPAIIFLLVVRCVSSHSQPRQPKVQVICPSIESEALQVIIGGEQDSKDWQNKLVRASEEHGIDSKIKVELQGGRPTTESYETIERVWTLVMEHNPETVEIQVNAPYNCSLPQVEFFDRKERHVARFFWAGELKHLPPQLRLPYLPYFRGLGTLHLSNCRISTGDFHAILLACLQLREFTVHSISRLNPVLCSIPPRKRLSPFTHHLDSLTISSSVDVNQLFVRVNFANLHILSIISESKTPITELGIKWSRLGSLYLRCRLRRGVEQSIRSQMHQKYVDIKERGT